MNRILIVLFCFVLISVFPDTTHSETKTIYETYKYVMGDNDSKNDARRICFLEAKRRIIEKAGVLIESFTEVDKFTLKKDEIRSYASAIIQVEIEKETITSKEETVIIEMTVKAEVDPEMVKTQLSKIGEDKELQEKIKKQQVQVAELEKIIDQLQKQISSVDYEEAGKLRKERNVVIKEIEDTEKIVFTIKSTTQKAYKNIKQFMTEEEVIKVAGKPRSIDKYLEDKFYNYGEIWVWFASGIVKGYVPMESWEGPSYRYKYKEIYKEFPKQ